MKSIEKIAKRLRHPKAHPYDASGRKPYGVINLIRIRHPKAHPYDASGRKPCG